jgi:hypothetical protein
MDLFGWRSPRDSAAHKAPIFGPQAILQDLDNRVPKYLDDADQGKLIIQPAREYLRTPTAMSDRSGTIRD